MRPSKIAAPVWQASGLSGSAGAGHPQHRSRHRIEHAVAMRVGDRKPVRIDRRLRLDAEFLDGAVRQHHVDGLGLFRGRGGGGIIGRHQRAVDDAALRGAGAGAAGEGLQQARRCRRRRRRKTGRPRCRWSRRPCRRECRPASPHIARPAGLARSAACRRQPDSTQRRRTGCPAPAAPIRASRGEIMLNVVTCRAVL